MDAFRPLKAEMPDRDRPGARRPSRQQTKEGTTVEPFEITGSAPGTALRLTQSTDGTTSMTVWDLDRSGFGGRMSVVLRTGWLRPLAAWFAGEAEPASMGGNPLDRSGYRLAVYPDELALVWSTHTEAWLRCAEPYGEAAVVIGLRGRMASTNLAVRLSPGARAATAAHLRRTDAERWALPAVR
jgi:hypothetical protein